MPALSARRRGRRVARSTRPTTLTLLLGHYLAGRIADSDWDRISTTLDAADEDPANREALAAFCLDAASRGEEIKPANEEEVLELVNVIRG